MADALLVDTDILIDHLKKVPQALDFVRENRERIQISSMSVLELYTGIRDREFDEVQELLDLFEVLPVDEGVARIAGLWRRKYMRSHHLGIPDVLIAATAQHRGIPLATLNRKHFPMLPVVTPYTKP